jgi:two-component system KDP operon response regulator KdpE
VADRVVVETLPPPVFGKEKLVNTILIANDAVAVTERLQSKLEDEGYKTLVAVDGTEVPGIIEKELPDLVILNLAIPRVDGYEVLHQLRELWQIPVIVVSNFKGTDDKVRCLNLGADDYVTVPFGVEETIARIKAVLRRNKRPTQTHLIYDDLEIDFNARRVTVNGNEVRLTPIEYRLLQQMAHNAGKVLTHNYLLAKVWGDEYKQSREYLHVFMNHLRAKIESDPKHPRYIVTVPGIGYRFR